MVLHKDGDFLPEGISEGQVNFIILVLQYDDVVVMEGEVSYVSK